MYPGISFFLPNITNGRNLKTIVTATHTAISVTALKSILSIPPKSSKIHRYRCIVRNFQFRKFLPVCSNLGTVFILFPVLRKNIMNYAVVWLLSVFLLPRISVKITVIEIIDGIRKADAPKINRQITDAATPATALL